MQRERGMQSGFHWSGCLKSDQSRALAVGEAGRASCKREPARWSTLATSRASRVVGLQLQLISIVSQTPERVRSAPDDHNRSASESCRGPSISCSAQLLRSITFASASLGFATCMRRLRQWLLRHGVSIDERLALVKGDGGSAAVTARGDILPGTTRAFAALFKSRLCSSDHRFSWLTLAFAWGGKSQRFRNLLVSRTARPPSPYLPTGSMTSRQLSA